MIKRWMTAPVFEDPRVNRQARLLNAVVWPTLGIAVVLLIGLGAAGSPLPVLISVMAMAITQIGSILLLHRGRIQQASLLFVFAGWAVTAIPALLQDNLASTFVFFSMVMVVLASLLLERRYVQIITGLSVGFAIILLINMEYPFVAQVISTSSPMRRFLGMVAALLAISTIVQLTMGSLRSALSEAEENGKRLRETNRMLEESQAVLEQRVSERTAALEGRARQLQAAAEVGAAVASVRDLDILLGEITGTLSERFGYYYVGIYLIDEAGKVLNLRAANTEIGRKLIAQNFCLPINQSSMAASTVRTRQARVAVDVRADDQYRALDELSLTRSEITLPIISGDTLLGVLDLQDAQIRTPSSDDLATLRLLTNQIAIAIDNALLFATNQKSLESLQRAYGSMSREGWEKVLRGRGELGFVAGVSGPPAQTTQAWQAEMVAAQASGKVVQSDEFTLAVPIMIRNQAAGVVRLRKPTEAGSWKSDEILLVQTLSDRLSTALESARLYEETRRRAERERLTGEITARMRASNDPQTILQVAARELRKALKADQLQLVVQATPLSGSQD